MAQSNRLSDREQEVVNLLLEGKSNKLIASALGISERTVEFHLKNIYAKYQVSSRMELVLKLGQSTGAGKREIAETSDKLGHSTVENMGEIAENGDLSNSRNWTTSLRETVSLIGKELKMENTLNSNVSEGGNSVTFFESIRVCFTKYADFNGRASRSEFWWFALFITLVASALMYLSQSLSNVFMVAILLPLLAAGSRRLHDTGKSGWWLLFILAPVGGIMLLMILWAMPPTVEATSD
jgi:DNA-binding CsgD family transcriptional regulator